MQLTRCVNGTSTRLIYSDLMSLGSQVPSKKMFGGSESLGSLQM